MNPYRAPTTLSENKEESARGDRVFMCIIAGIFILLGLSSGIISSIIGYQL